MRHRRNSYSFWSVLIKRYGNYLINAKWTFTEVENDPSEPLRMMTSSNGNIFRVTGPLCGEFTGPSDFPAQRPVTWIYCTYMHQLHDLLSLYVPMPICSFTEMIKHILFGFC